MHAVDEESSRYMDSDSWIRDKYSYIKPSLTCRMQETTRLIIMTLDPRDLQSGDLLLAEDKSAMHRFEPACCRIRFVVARGGPSLEAVMNGDGF